MSALLSRAARVAVSVFSISVVSGGCSSGPQLFGDQSLIVNSPIYRANKVFYVDPPRTAAPGEPQRWSNLTEPFADRSTARAVKNGDPVTIVVNKAYVPISLATASRGVSDTVFQRQTRDIAVLLDLGLKRGADEQFIAVWYERGVPADAELTFENLPVFSLDAWDSDVPPYFRVRLVDVTAERNARTSEILKLAGSVGSSVASLVSTPAAGLAVSLGARAAQLVLANDQNRILVDYTFSFFGASHIGESGGMPLGLFKQGGVVVTGLPYGSPNEYWESQFQYDFQLRRVQLRSVSGKGNQADVPYLIATVMTAEAAIPNVVKRRSDAITKRLSDPSAVQEDLRGVIDEVKALYTSLQVLERRQDFRKFPSTDSFQSMVTTARDTKDLPKAETDFLLSTFRQVTGATRSTFAGYKTWIEKCAPDYELSRESRKYGLKKGATEKPECR